jgi:hypothetical protein
MSRPGLALPPLALPLALLLALLLAPGVGAASGGADDVDPPPPPAASVTPAGAPLTPSATATQHVTASLGATSVTAGILNPAPSGAPLWLWVEPAGKAAGDLLLEDRDGTILWRLPVARLRPEGQVVVTPRPSTWSARLVLTDQGARALSGDLVMADPRRPTSLPVLLAGGPETAALAERMRARAPDRLVHVIPPAALPATPAAYLGVSAIITGVDAVLPTRVLLGLKLFSCARSGVLSLAPQPWPVRGACPDPPVLVGEQGVPSASAILGSLRDLQAVLGILEERGSNGLTPGGDDADAAGGLLARRPSAQAGVGLMVLLLLACGVVAWWGRKLRPTLTLALMFSVPVAGALAMAALALVPRTTAEAIRLVTVDARQGAPVALARVVEAAWTPPRVEASETAWVVRVERPRDSVAAKGQRLPVTVEVWDAVDVPGNWSVRPHPAAPDQLQVSLDQVALPGAALPCGTLPTRANLEGEPVQRSLGKVLLSRCLRQRGLLVPVDPALLPALHATLGDLPARPAQAGWLYLLERKEDRP